MQRRLPRKPKPQSPDSPVYSRGYLPHHKGSTQSLTFRLYDAVPQKKILQWKKELDVKSSFAQSEANAQELRRRIDKYEDAGHGQSLLRHPDIATLVQDALLHFNGIRYCLHAWCIMPNHVHVLLTLHENYTLSQIEHTWKSFTAKAINRRLNRVGQLWEPESFDRFIRDENHFKTAKTYIENNPVAAGLVLDPSAWRFSSAFGGDEF